MWSDRRFHMVISSEGPLYRSLIAGANEPEVLIKRPRYV